MSQHAIALASFPGLPHFSVLRFALTDAEEQRVLLSAQPEEQKEWGRPGNEATIACVCYIFALPFCRTEADTPDPVPA